MAERKYTSVDAIRDAEDSLTKASNPRATLDALPHLIAAGQAFATLAIAMQERELREAQAARSPKHRRLRLYF